MKSPLLLSTIVCLLAVTGCNSQKPVTIPSESSSSGATRCEETLSSVLDMIEPERLGISADLDSAVSLLNRWNEECASSEVGAAQLQPETRRLLTGNFSEAQLADLSGQSQGRFTERDVEHLRNCRLFRHMVRHITADASTELERILALFYYIDRNLELVPSDPQAIPFTPYDVMLLGRGTAEQRTWIFAELLRQMHVPAVVLRAPAAGPPAAGGEAESPAQPADRWLVGVLSGEQVYLFDVSLGMPLPGAEDSSSSVRVTQPATLEEVQQNPDLLRALDVGPSRPYAWTAEDLQNARVEVITSAGFLAPRMVSLELEMAGDRAALIYDPLDDVDGAPGLLSRVANLGGGGQFDRSRLAVWSFPEQQLAAAAHLSEDQLQTHNAIMASFQGPLMIEHVSQDPVTGEMTFPLEQDQLKTRLQQLLGDHVAAIKNYLSIRLMEQLPPDTQQFRWPDIYRRLNAIAARDAYFWVGTAQLDQENFAGASETFQGYILRHRQAPATPWLYQSRILLAHVFAAQSNYEDGATILESFPVQHPQSHGLALYARRMRQLAKASPGGESSPASESTESTPKGEPTPAGNATPAETPPTSAPTTSAPTTPAPSSATSPPNEPQPAANDDEPVEAPQPAAPQGP